MNTFRRAMPILGLLAFFVVLGSVAAQKQKVKPPAAPATPKAEAAEEKVDPKHPWEVRLNDGTLKKINVLDEKVTLDTKFGPLDIPLADVKRIEFGLRMTDDEKKALDAAVADVLSGEPKQREKGKDTLLAMGAKATPFVQRAAKGRTGESRAHLEMVIDKLKVGFTEKDGTVRDYDLVVTADGSILSGLIRGGQVKMATEKDGELALKTTSARLLVFGSTAALEDKIDIVDLNAVGGMNGIAQRYPGKVVGITVTGRVGGSVWGSNPYTNDSDPGTAALHAGALTANETAVIKIRVQGDAGGYQGSTANGVTSGNWGPYQPGCYEILGKQKKN